MWRGDSESHEHSRRVGRRLKRRGRPAAQCSWTSESSTPAVEVRPLDLSSQCGAATPSRTSLSTGRTTPARRVRLVHTRPKAANGPSGRPCRPLTEMTAARLDAPRRPLVRGPCPSRRGIPPDEGSEEFALVRRAWTEHPCHPPARWRPVTEPPPSMAAGVRSSSWRATSAQRQCPSLRPLETRPHRQKDERT
jgi:hypothetical protein